MNPVHGVRPARSWMGQMRGRSASTEEEMGTALKELAMEDEKLHWNWSEGGNRFDKRMRLGGERAAITSAA